MKTFGIVLKKKHKTDKEGYLNLRITENQKSTFKSLGIKLKETYWNASKGRVKPTDKVAYKQLNDELEAILKQAEKDGEVKNSSAQPLPPSKPTKKRIKTNDNTFDDSGNTGFVEYFQNLINGIQNVGSQKKTKTYLYGFTEYLKSINKIDISLGEIDKKFVGNLQDYLKSTRQPSTVFRYMKAYKSVLKQAVAAELVFYKYHPFADYKFKDVEVREKYLTKDEVNRIIEFHSTNKSLQHTRNKFVFSIFANGMRISDLLTIRFGSYHKQELTYWMFKTKQKMTLKITQPLAIAFANILMEHPVSQTLKEYKEYKDFEEHYQNYTNHLTELLKTRPLNFPKALLESWQKVKYSEGVAERLERQEKGINDDLQLKYYKLLVERHTHILLVEIARKHPKQFIIPNELVVDKFDKLDLKQQYNQIQARTTIYNSKLKDLQQVLEIPTTLTTHLARHTYASLMLTEAKADVYSISKSLNHKNLAITERYMKRFDKEKTDKANDDLANQF